MKAKKVLAALFLFACGVAILGGAAMAADETGPAYYYGSAPYEQDMKAESGQQRYPDYLPPEFGIKPQPPEQAVPVEQGISETPVSADFVPYDEAQRKYSGQNGTPPEQDFPQPQAPAANTAPADPAPEIEIQDGDGFVPYEYAREKYSN